MRDALWPAFRGEFSDFICTVRVGADVEDGGTGVFVNGTDVFVGCAKVLVGFGGFVGVRMGVSSERAGIGVFVIVGIGVCVRVGVSVGLWGGMGVLVGAISATCGVRYLASTFGGGQPMSVMLSASMRETIVPLLKVLAEKCIGRRGWFSDEMDIDKLKGLVWARALRHSSSSLRCCQSIDVTKVILDLV